MKKIFALSLVLVMVFSMCGCGATSVKNTQEIDNALMGGWSYSNFDPEASSGLSIAFVFADGEVGISTKVIAPIYGIISLEPESGTYVIGKDKIIITIEGSDNKEITYEYNNGNLELWYGELKLEKVV